MASPSYWCYRCSLFVRVTDIATMVCPNCESGFVEQLDSAPRIARVHASRWRFPRTAVSPSDSDRISGWTIRTAHQNVGERCPFNPVIVLRRPSDEADGGETRGFEFYYFDASYSSGLRRLPAGVSESLLGSGFDRLLEQLPQMETNRNSRRRNLPATKEAIESMARIQIRDNHVEAETSCAVCKDAFILGAEAREMPCKHFYHADCILPWLALRNSCPVCRHELPSETQCSEDSGISETGGSTSSNREERLGLTIWRLPGGGFAVERFQGTRRLHLNRDFPAVYPDARRIDYGGGPRRIPRGSEPRRGREKVGLSRIIHDVLSCFREPPPESTRTTSTGRPTPDFQRSTTRQSRPRRQRSWSLDVNSGELSQ